MKNSLDHLPKNKQDELQKITTTIQNNCLELEKIILFGSYARGNYREAKDLDKHRKSGHVSDYDILVVTKTKEVALNHTLFNQIKDQLKKFKLSADPRITTHDIAALNIKLAEGQYFFSDIKKEGILLFDNKETELAEKRLLTKEEERRMAQDNFDSWFGRAKGFFDSYEFSLSKPTENHFQEKLNLALAAFNLHQSAEHALKTITLVFTNYCPNEHYLRFIQDDIEDFYPQINNFFKQDTARNEERVKLLEYAYIGGRYDPDYYISKEDLEILAKDVEKLLKITKEICEKKS